MHDPLPETMTIDEKHRFDLLGGNPTSFDVFTRKKGQVVDCRSEEGITISLIDTIINSARLLRSRDLSHSETQEALKDLRGDEDVLFLVSPIKMEIPGDNLPDRIIKFRKKNSFSQSELASQIGISRNYLSQIERGVAKNISHETALKIHSVIGGMPA